MKGNESGLIMFVFGHNRQEQAISTRCFTDGNRVSGTVKTRKWLPPRSQSRLACQIGIGSPLICISLSSGCGCTATQTAKSTGHCHPKQTDNSIRPRVV